MQTQTEKKMTNERRIELMTRFFRKRGLAPIPGQEKLAWDEFSARAISATHEANDIGGRESARNRLINHFGVDYDEAEQMIRGCIGR